MDSTYFVTDYGLAMGWRCMHNGGFCLNPASRYAPHGAYTPATYAELDAAVERGELRKEFGYWKHVGGILRDWVPVA